MRDVMNVDMMISTNVITGEEVEQTSEVEVVVVTATAG